MKILYILSLIMTILYILAIPLCVLGVPAIDNNYAKGWKLVFYTTLLYPLLWWSFFFTEKISFLFKLLPFMPDDIKLLQIILMFSAVIITIIGFLIMD